jgi:hypothetical protein
MRFARQLLEAFAFALAAGAVIIVFHSFGGFSFRASLLLGVCFTIVALWVYQTYKVATFKPYSVQFFVNFEALREDLGMKKCTEPTDDEELAHELYNFTAFSAALFVHYREYVAQTANELKLTGRSTRTDDEYSSAILFGDTIPGILKFTTEWGNPRTNMFWFPRFIFSHGWKGFELRLQVVPEWWSEYKKHLSPEMRDLPVNYDGFIVLAHLPYGYIPDHVRRWHEPTNLFYPFDRVHRQWKSKLAKDGWSFTDTGEEISSHYLIVRYRPIWPAS